ncbi:MAG: D-alanine--D-alanine ligase [Sphingobacteriia bacterium]|nr:D-alanine--D-alanine ligase [Sphingobacteriia bacterium]
MEIRKSEILEEHHVVGSKKHIAVFTGGESKEREVSLVSGRGVCNSLKKLGYKYTSIDPGFDISDMLTRVKPDLVFNALHGTYGEDGRIPALLDIMRIPYTHSGTLASAIAFNKEFCNSYLANNGILIPNRKIINIKDKITSEPLPRPYVVKPIAEGSSVGVEVVFKEDNFDIIGYIHAVGDHYGDRLIVEEYIPGREIQVGIVNNKAIDVLEIKTHRKFYDYEAKYAPGGSEHIMPVDMKPEKRKEVLEISEKIHKLIGAKDISRVEFRYNDDPKVDKFFFLEINTHPGFTPTSIVPEIASFHGISYDQIIETLVGNARCF